MRSAVVFCLALLTFTVFAQTDRRLANGHVAYYGQEFMTKPITKELLYKILSETHTIVSNQPDVIGPSCQGQCYQHTSVGYDGARKIMFGETFIEKDSSGNFVKDVYCGKKFYFRDVNDVSNMHAEVNIEHTWPQSKFSPNFEKNMQKSDMHHLFPTDSLANNRRANHDFGEVVDAHNELNVQNCLASKLGDISGHFLFTPPPVHKGNVARSLFYFATRYRMPIEKAAEMILRRWHSLDPVDDTERVRHEIVAKYEKVRNPFVDYPQLVEKVADF